MMWQHALAALSLASFLAAVPAPASAAEAAWKPAAGPLMTSWAKDVSPENVHPEYPRPQMVREAWQNLNGLWQYADAAEGDAPPVGKDLDGRILVPFPIESALSGVMKQGERMWYRRTMAVPAEWKGKRVLLHFGAVDWEATVYVNGKKIGDHRGGFDPFSFDITDALKEGGPQELIVGVFDPTNNGQQPRGKQVLKPGGIMYTSTTGIWQTVWMEPVPDAAISGLVLTPDVDGSCLRLTVDASGKADDLQVEAVALADGKPVCRVAGKPGAALQLPIAKPRLWSPEDPYLYDLKVEMKRGGKPVDAVTSYFGMRKVTLAKDDKGINRLFLNGKPYFQVGPLDQGFWPDGLYTAPTDAALKFDIEITKKLGFNMARKHVKVEPDRWYYWCDKLGLLVWQDMPSGDNGVQRSRKDGEKAAAPPPTPEQQAATAAAQKQFEAELAAMIRARRNHPSIIVWVVFNEGWGQYDTERLAGWVKEADPSRLVNSVTGWVDKKVGDMIDMHKYPAPGCPPTEEKRAAVLGEFGGLGLAVDGHTWKKDHWGYRGMADAEELASTYEKYLRTVYQLKDSSGLSAIVYTQTTDVEVECNGLLTYDRAIIKADLERIAAANRGDFSKVPPPPVVKVIVPTSEESPQEWRYTFEKPADGWEKPGFDDAAWKKGPGGFGTEGTPGAVVKTAWKTEDIWLRREVTLPDAKLISPRLRVHHDEDVEIYVDGVRAGAFKNFTTDYVDLALTPEGRAALKPGKNLLAVHCKQIKGGQYIDVGVVDLLPGK